MGGSNLNVNPSQRSVDAETAGPDDKAHGANLRSAHDYISIPTASLHCLTGGDHYLGLAERELKINSEGNTVEPPNKGNYGANEFVLRSSLS